MHVYNVWEFINKNSWDYAIQYLFVVAKLGSQYSPWLLILWGPLVSDSIVYVLFAWICLYRTSLFAMDEPKKSLIRIRWCLVFIASFWPYQSLPSCLSLKANILLSRSTRPELNGYSQRQVYWSCEITSIIVRKFTICWLERGVVK